ncbi:MAG: rhodanese-like domain-containing protein [Phycisphaerae bacterium]
MTNTDADKRVRARPRRRWRRRLAWAAVFIGLAAAVVFWQRRAVALAIAEQWFNGAAGVPLITADSALADAVDSGELLLIDVREAREFAVSHLPGAINVPWSQFENETTPEIPDDRPAVIYCTVGYRSGLAAERWIAAGIDARNLRGGIIRWAEADLPIINANGPTRRVHTFSSEWSWLLPPGYEAVAE